MTAGSLFGTSAPVVRICAPCGATTAHWCLGAYRVCHDCRTSGLHIIERLGWTATRFVTWMMAERKQAGLDAISEPPDPPVPTWRGRGPGAGPQ